MSELPHRDTDAWKFQAWAAFLVAFGTTGVAIVFLPVNGWNAGLSGHGPALLVNACFTLAKTVRDNHEGQRLINRISDAKAEKLLHEFEGKSPLSPIA